MTNGPTKTAKTTKAKRGRSRVKPRKAPAKSKTDLLRERLAERLPEMLDAAITAYQRIADPGGADDPKSFAASQTGAKAALAHIEQLIVLAEAIIRDLPSGHAGDTAAAEQLVAQAKAALGSDAEPDSETVVADVDEATPDGAPGGETGP